MLAKVKPKPKKVAPLVAMKPKFLHGVVGWCVKCKRFVRFGVLDNGFYCLPCFNRRHRQVKQKTRGDRDAHPTGKVS